MYWCSCKIQCFWVTGVTGQYIIVFRFVERTTMLFWKDGTGRMAMTLDFPNNKLWQPGFILINIRTCFTTAYYRCPSSLWRLRLSDKRLLTTMQSTMAVITGRTTEQIIPRYPPETCKTCRSVICPVYKGKIWQKEAESARAESERSGPRSVSDLWQFTLRLTCKCVYLRVYTLNQFRDLRTMSGLELKIGSVLCLCTPVSPSVPEM